jgi:hypothetical protein
VCQGSRIRAEVFSREASRVAMRVWIFFLFSLFSLSFALGPGAGPGGGFFFLFLPFSGFGFVVGR